MEKTINIAVDGTAGSGKSSVMKLVAAKLGFEVIDTGLMYRAYTKFCLENKINFNFEDQIVSLLDQFNCHYDANGKIFVNEIDYTDYTDDYEVAENVKFVAATVKVREKMVEWQKQLAVSKGKIMVGRDITTVVLPEAELKIYLDSSSEARALRRFVQNEENGVTPNVYKDILRQIEQRDSWDQNRSTGALKVASDAWYLDTSLLTIEEVVDQVVEKIQTII